MDNHRLTKRQLKNPRGVYSRNYGIDLLRALSIFLVVLLHILQTTNSLTIQQTNSLGYVLCWFLYAFCICAVNTFAIISGYVCAKTKFRLKKFIGLWIEILFYSVLSYLIRFLINKDFDTVLFLKSFIPIYAKFNWYFSAYFLIMIFMPLYNLAIRQMTQRVYLFLFAAIFVFVCLGCTVFYNTWGINEGNSFLWLSIMYFVGAYFQKFGLPKGKASVYLLVYVGTSILLCLSKIILNIIMPHIIGSTRGSGILFIYTSPLAVLQTIALFSFFAKLNIKRNHKFIFVLSKSTVGIALIHAVGLIFPQKIGLLGYSPWLYIPLVIACGIVIYIASFLVDIIRQLIFKYCGINKLCDKVGDSIQSGFDKIIMKRIKKSKNKELSENLGSKE